jgi:hypothetical protein
VFFWHPLSLLESTIHSVVAEVVVAIVLTLSEHISILYALVDVPRVSSRRSLKSSSGGAEFSGMSGQ